MDRNVTIRYNDKFLVAVSGVEVRTLDQAVGYLSTWAITSPRYVNVCIFGDNEGNLHGTYKDSKGDVTYTLFGLLDKNMTYSFHS